MTSVCIFITTLPKSRQLVSSVAAFLWPKFSPIFRIFLGSDLAECTQLSLAATNLLFRVHYISPRPPENGQHLNKFMKICNVQSVLLAILGFPQTCSQ